MTHSMSDAAFEGHRDVQEAMHEDRLRAEFVRDTNVTLTSAAWKAGTLYLNITNTGGTVLDAADATLFVDGAYANGEIDSLTVVGRSTSLWAPGELLRIQASPTSLTRAYFVIETGRGLVWTP